MGFNKQTDYLISARRPDLIIINKKNCKTLDFAFTVDHRINLKECEKKDLAREWKKNMEHESDACANCDWCFWHNN